MILDLPSWLIIELNNRQWISLVVICSHNGCYGAQVHLEVPDVRRLKRIKKNRYVHLHYKDMNNKNIWISHLLCVKYLFVFFQVHVGSFVMPLRQSWINKESGSIDTLLANSSHVFNESWIYEFCFKKFYVSFYRGLQNIVLCMIKI